MLKEIAAAINEYKGPMDAEKLITYVIKQTGSPRPDVLEVIDFLQTINLPAKRTVEIPDAPLVLADEIQFGYHVAKNMLKDLVNETLPDNEEVRKTLREIQRFLDIMLKMQERVYNVQEIQKFQEAVFRVLDGYSLREAVVDELLSR